MNRIERLIAKQHALFGLSAEDRAAAFERATGGGNGVAPAEVPRTPWCMFEDGDGLMRGSCWYRSTLAIRRLDASGLDSYHCANVTHRALRLAYLQGRSIPYLVDPATVEDMERLLGLRRRTTT